MILRQARPITAKVAKAISNGIALETIKGSITYTNLYLFKGRWWAVIISIFINSICLFVFVTRNILKIKSKNCCEIRSVFCKHPDVTWHLRIYLIIDKDTIIELNLFIFANQFDWIKLNMGLSAISKKKFSVKTFTAAPLPIYVTWRRPLSESLGINLTLCISDGMLGSLRCLINSFVCCSAVLRRLAVIIVYFITKHNVRAKTISANKAIAFEGIRSKIIYKRISVIFFILVNI